MHLRDEGDPSSHRRRTRLTTHGNVRRPVNVHGPGGVGKSALVNWAAHELYESRAFEAILQLTAKETMLADDGIRRFGRSLYSLENLLDHVLLLFEEKPPLELESRKAAAIEVLKAWSTLLV